ncbi:HPr family phosphocarrier protein [Fonticella tunisiensis]|uniref:Phosphocarrier protein HPr n=1 Tax=Fonticella tunisiensis TaxID=1096341 RepID=A0A4V3ES00_9CLOT|nr:HPr family phosphocarrier protein [Fonticella tunisiensis]TDT50948.1 phosphocarrier protein [Fonticella tunisiensis]
MVERKVVVKNKTGLHARPATLVVSEGNKFKSSITIKKGEKEVNIKSLLGLLGLGVAMGDEVIIKAEGEDENQAVEAIVKLIENLNE